MNEGDCLVKLAEDKKTLRNFVQILLKLSGSE